MLTETQVGILRDVKANKVDLDGCHEWLRQELIQILADTDVGILIDTEGPAVILTREGHDFLKIYDALAPKDRPGKVVMVSNPS